MSTKTLAADFADLNDWVATWALDTESERLAVRAATDFGEIRAFYDAMAPRMDEVIEHLNQTELAQLSGEQAVLFQLAQSYFEASLAVELLREPDEATMLPPARLRVDIDGGLS